MLRRSAPRAAGFTMIELIVTLTIFALLVAMTVPAMQKWVADNKVRAVADALQNGLRLAQTESLRRSRQVVFALTNSTTLQLPGFTAAAGGSYWAVQTIPAMLDGSENPVVAGSGVILSNGSGVQIAGPAAICFNSLGRLIAQNTTGVGAACAAPTTVVNNVPMAVYNVTMSGADHAMNVEVALGGQLHLCDPTQTLSASNPYGC